MFIGGEAGPAETEGLKEKFGKADADPRCRCPLAAELGTGGGGICWEASEGDSRLRAVQLSSEGEASADRAGKTKSGLGNNSMLWPLSGTPLR